MMDGKTLKEVRQFLGLSGEEAGKLCCMTKQAVSHIEKGVSKKGSTRLLMETLYRQYAKDHYEELRDKNDELRMMVHRNEVFLDVLTDRNYE